MTLAYFTAVSGLPAPSIAMVEKRCVWRQGRRVRQAVTCWLGASLFTVSSYAQSPPVNTPDSAVSPANTAKAKSDSTKGTAPKAGPGQPGASPPKSPEEPASSTQARRSSFGATDPYTVFQVGLSLLALPHADVCPISPDNCEPGETSIAISLQNLYRFREFGVGAGIIWAFGLRSDAARGADELGREHSRGYFLFQAQFRYYLPQLFSWDWWLGTTVGGVVISDSWSVLADREPYSDTAFVGPRAMTVATEGLTLGLGVGGNWRFYDNFLFGTRFNYSNWFLPSERELTPLGDQASLAGRIDVLDFGLFLAYRIPI